MSAPTELTVRGDAVELGTLRADSPRALVTSAQTIADQLSSVIDSRGLFSNIQGKKYVQVEGWTTLLALLGVVPSEVSNLTDDDGQTFTATVELVRMSDNQVVGRASAECGADEPAWKARPRYARRSMAATRATGKAARLSFSWIVSLAGYAATPAEEMPSEPERAPRIAQATVEMIHPPAKVDGEDDNNPFSVAKYYAKRKAKTFKDSAGAQIPVYAYELEELVEKRAFADQKGWESWVKAIDDEFERRSRYETQTKTEPRPDGDELPF